MSSKNLSGTNRTHRVGSNAPPPAPASSRTDDGEGDYICRICGKTMDLPDDAIPIGRSKFGFRMYQIGREAHDLKKVERLKEPQVAAKETQ